MKALKGALAAAYLVFTALAPFLDYRGGSYFLMLGLYGMSPLVLGAIVLSVGFFFAALRAAIALRAKARSASACYLGVAAPRADS